MKKTVRIITLIVSALLLIGAVIGITVSAEDNAPAVAIKYKNLAYEGAIQVLYAVEAENVPDGAKVQMYFYDTKDATDPSFIKDEYTDEALTIGGKTYRAFFSKGIAPKNMRKPIYAAPVIVNGDEIVAKGELVEYSIYTYATNMFAKSPTKEQKALYSALLDYGASVQAVLLGTNDYTEADLLAAGGYANEYCGVKIGTVINGVLTEESELLGYYAPGEAIALTAETSVEGAMFTGFKNADRETIGNYSYTATAYTSEPGISTFYKTYRNDAAVNDYTNGYITTKNDRFYYYPDKYPSYSNNYYVSSGSYNKIVNYGTEETPNYAIQHSHSDGVSSGSIHYAYYTTGKAYIFESDFCFDGVTGEDTGTDNWFGRIGFVSKATAGRSSQYNFVAYNNMYGRNGVGASFNGVSLPDGEWVRLRFEYVPLGYISGEYTENKVVYEGRYIGLYRVYQEGVLVYETTMSTAMDNSDCMKFEVGSRQSGNAGGWSMKLDNTVCYTIYDDYYGKGLYSGLAPEYDSEQSYGSAVIEENYGDNKVLHIDKKVDKSPSVNFTLDEVTFGDTYVFDTDILWESMPTSDFKRGWMGRFGFISEHTNSTALSEDDRFVRSNSYSAYPAYGMYVGNGSYGTLGTGMLQSPNRLAPGVWYNLRVEYTPLGVDADGYYHGNQKIYINGVLLSDVDAKETIVSKYVEARGNIKNNLGLVGFQIGTLAYNSASFKLDNTYLGVIGENEGYKVNDFASIASNATASKAASNPYITLAAANECVSEQTIVANPIATDAKSAANNVLKVVTTPDSDTSKSNHLINTILPSTSTPSAAATGVYVIEFDILSDPNNELPAKDAIFMQIVPDASKYMQIFRLTHKGDGNIEFKAETGGDGGGKGATFGTVKILDGQWHNVRFVYKKGGAEDTMVALYVDGTLVSEKNVYFHAVAVENPEAITKVHWRLREFAPSGEATSATYYYDNVAVGYLGDLPEN